MRIYSLFTILFFIHIGVNAQQVDDDLSRTSSRLLIEGRHLGGNGRTYLTLRNLSNNSGACVDMRLYSGTGSTFTSFGHHSPGYGSGYTYLPLYAGYGQIWNTGAGLILRASPATEDDPQGIIRFETGWRNEGTAYERMRISADGNIGIACTDPKTQLHIGQGDIYLQQPESGIIMTSSNGQCWKLTVTDRGKAKYTRVECPR